MESSLRAGPSEVKRSQALGGLPMIIIALACLGALNLVSFYNYLLFHTVAEMFSVAISWSMFILVWNARRWNRNHYLLLIGVAFAAASSIDLVHTLAYKGMNVFPGYDANLPTQLWIAARYLQSLSMLAAALLLGSRYDRFPAEAVAAAYGIVTLALLVLAFVGLFPTCYIEGVGLTLFKRLSEYVISLVLMASLAVLWIKRRLLASGMFRLLAIATAATISSELAFIFYVGAYDSPNLIGHDFRFVALACLYLAIIKDGLQRPYDLLFRELDERERKLRALFELLPVGVSILDADRKVVQVNPALEAILGLDRGGLMQGEHHTRRYLRPDGSVMPSAEFASSRALREQQPVFDVETGVMIEDGSTVWANVSAVPVLFSDWRVVIVTSDITRRKLAEEALRDSRQSLLSLIENTDGSIWSVDAEYRLIVGNKRFHETLRAMCGREVTEGDDLLALDLPPDEIDNWRERYDRGLRGERFAVDVVTRFAGVPRVVEYRVNPIKMEDGRITGVTFFGRDITERKRTEEEVRRTAEELRQSNEELEQFAYVASHDLQEPLRVVTMYLQFLAMRYKGKLDDDAKLIIDSAMEGARRMQRLIQDLLDLSRVGTRNTVFQETDSNAVLSDALHSLQLALDEADARVTHDPLPTIMADEGQLARVFQNLIDNALKFRGSEPPVIHVSAERREAQWLFTVRDNGIGIEPAYSERIFGIFQRLPSTQECSGTGIGLAVCKKIVERHGGRIWVESQPGQGSVFCFTLPACEAA